MLFVEVANDFAGERVGFVVGDAGELFGECFGDVLWGGEDVVVEGDWLICRRGIVLAGKGFEEGPELGRVSPVVGFGEEVLPFFAGVEVSQEGDLVIEDRDFGISRIC